jgi:hypothetical protein
MAKVIGNGLGITLHGKAGSAVFALTKYGLVLRPRTMPRNPRTPAQQAARARLSAVSAMWTALSAVQREDWSEAASRLAPHASRPGMTGQTLYIALGAKYLQVDPSGTPPAAPPDYPFFGDGITLAAVGAPGQVDFTASGPNAANVVTELLLQPIIRPSRAPKGNLYRPQVFFPFAPGSLTFATPVDPGWYAPAYRFVNIATGQQSLLLPLPVAQVV